MERIQHLPTWRLDNAIPLLAVVIGIIANVGALFWWGARLQINQEYMLANQKQQIEMWLKLEQRTGQLELSSATNIAEHREIMRALNLK